MDINRLSYFVVIAECGCLRKASTLLHLSPPALSKALRILEEEVGFTLTIPSGRGIIVTDEGKLLATKAKEILASVQELKNISRKSEDSANRLRLGTFEVFSTYFVGRLMKGHLKDHMLESYELVPGAIEAALMDGRIDAGITYLPVPTAGIEHLEVTSIEMGVFGSKAFEKNMRAEDISPSDFARIPFVVPIQPLTGSPTKAQGLDGWPEDRQARVARYKVTLMETAIELCRQGLAAAYLPAFVVRLHNEVVAEEHALRSLGSLSGLRTKAQPVYLVKRKSQIEGRAIKKLAAELRKLR